MVYVRHMDQGTAIVYIQVPIQISIGHRWERDVVTVGIERYTWMYYWYSLIRRTTIYKQQVDES